MKYMTLILSLFISAQALAMNSQGLQIANDWLEVIDAGDYSQSWHQTDDFFKAQLPQEKWQSALQGVRTPLGEVRSRTEISSKAYNALPGVPDGEYLVIQYKTEFEHKASAIETLTLSKKSGQWMPVGYFIK